MHDLRYPDAALHDRGTRGAGTGHGGTRRGSGFPVARAALDCLGVADRLAHGVAHLALARLIHRLADRVADLFGPGFPDGLADRVAADPLACLIDRLADRVADLLGPGLPDGFADRVANILGPGLPDGFADRVAADPFTCLIDRLADRVADLLGPGLPDGLADRVADLLGPGLPDGLADRVANILGPGLPDGLADRVADLLGPGLPDGLADRVADLLGPRFPDGFADCVVAGLHPRFPHGFADRVRALTIACLWHVLRAGDGSGLHHPLETRPVAGDLLLFIDHLPARLHHCVALLLAGGIFRRAARPLAAPVAGNATVPGFGHAGRDHHQDGQRQGHPQEPFHHFASFFGPHDSDRAWLLHKRDWLPNGQGPPD